MRAITAADVSKISRIDYLLTQFTVVVTYLRLLVLPINQNLDHDVPVYHNFLSPPVFLSFLFLSSLFAVAAILFYRSTVRIKHVNSGLDQSPSTPPHYRLISFGILWFFITLSVESSILPLGELIAEYRLYLPSIGVFIAFTSFLHLFLGRFSTDPKRVQTIFIPVLALTVAVLSFTAHARNHVWKDEITLWEDAARKSPAKLRPRQNLGTYNQIAGRLEEAKRDLLVALEIDPGNFEIHNNLGIVYRKLGDYSGAIREYETALSLMPTDPMARYNLGNIYLALGRYDDALEEYEECLKIIPDYDELHNNLGVVYQKTGRLREAVREFDTAVRINPENKNALNNLAVIKKSLNLR
jgi:tetratricopeptide (TPR) repeat protein